MKKNLCVAILVIAAVILGGCATIISGTNETLNVQAINANSHETVSNASCSITDANGVVSNLSDNPGSIQMRRGKGPLSVKCFAKGYKQAQVGVGTGFNAWTIVDVLFWPGIIVDAVDGAYSKYDNNHVTVLMVPNNQPYRKVKFGTVQYKKKS